MKIIYEDYTHIKMYTQYIFMYFTILKFIWLYNFLIIGWFINKLFNISSVIILLPICQLFIYYL